MRKWVLSLGFGIAAFLPSEAPAQEGSAGIGWLHQIATLGFPDERGTAVASDDVFVYVAGHTSGALPGQVARGNRDAFVRKYDSVGTILWTRQFGTPADESPNAVAAQGGAAYVVGSSSGALVGSRTGTTDAFVRKYDADGNEIWTRQFGSAGQGAPGLGVAVDPRNGDVVLVGLVTGPLDGQVHLGLADAFARKYDTAGNLLWAIQFGTLGGDAASSVVVGGDGAIYIAGFLGGLPGFVRKYDADGIHIWTREFGGGGGEVRPSAVALDLDDSVVWVGGSISSGGTLELDGLRFVSAGGAWDAFGAAFDSNTGAVRCGDQFGTAVGDFVNGIAPVPGGGLVVGGATGGSIALPGAAAPLGGASDGFARRYGPVAAGPAAQCSPTLWTHHVGSPQGDGIFDVSAGGFGLFVVGDTNGAVGDQNLGSFDAFVRRLDFDGEPLWTDQFGNPASSPAFDSANDIVTDSEGNAYAVGWTGGAVPGQVSTGGTDAWAQAYDAQGNILWTDQFGTPQSDRAMSVDFDVQQGGFRVFAAGWTAGTLPSLPGHPLNENSGGLDAFVRVSDALTGQEIWTRQFGTSSNDQARRVRADATGVYVSGWTEGAFPGHTNAGSLDLFLRKYDPDGNELWTLQFGTGGFDDGYGFTIDDQGSAFVTGWTDGPAFRGEPIGSADAFVARVNSQGHLSWVRQFGSPGANSWGTGVAVHGNRVIVTGATNGSLAGPHLGRADVFVLSLDRGGEIVWARQLGTPGADLHPGFPDARHFGASPYVVTDEVGILVAGATSGALPGQISAGGFDAFLMRFGHNGGLVWTLQFGTPANDGVLGLSTDPTGVSIARLVGVTQGILQAVPNAGAGDAFVAEIVPRE